MSRAASAKSPVPSSACAECRLLLLGPDRTPAIEPGTFDISGTLTFPQNGDFDILQDEICLNGLWEEDSGGIILGEERINTGWFTASHEASGCNGYDPVAWCFDTYAIPYVIPACRPDCCVDPMDCPVPCSDPSCEICDSERPSSSSRARLT